MYIPGFNIEKYSLSILLNISFYVQINIYCMCVSRWWQFCHHLQVNGSFTKHMIKQVLTCSLFRQYFSCILQCSYNPSLAVSCPDLNTPFPWCPVRLTARAVRYGAMHWVSHSSDCVLLRQTCRNGCHLCSTCSIKSSLRSLSLSLSFPMIAQVTETWFGSVYLEIVTAFLFIKMNLHLLSLIYVLVILKNTLF